MVYIFNKTIIFLKGIFLRNSLKNTHKAHQIQIKNKLSISTNNKNINFCTLLYLARKRVWLKYTKSIPTFILCQGS
jgi:hypothetical protein